MTEETTNGAAAAAAAEPSFEDAMGAIYDKMNAGDGTAANRDAGGRFAATAADTADTSTTDVTAKAAASAETTDTPATTGSETAAPSIAEPPASLSAGMKAKWAELSPEWREEIARRESEAHRQITQTGGRLKQLEAVDQVIEPYRAHLRREGVAEAPFIANLFAAAARLAQNPVEGLKELARSYGVDVAQLAGQPAGGTKTATGEEYVDPAVAEVRKQLDDTRKAVEALRGERLQEMDTAIVADITTFANAKDEQGKLRYPHFGAVQQDMAALFRANLVRTLDEAYEQAVWRRPDLREQLLTARDKAREEARKREQAEGVKRAERAAATNLSSSGTSAGTGTPAKGASMEETMGSVYDRLHA